MEDFLYKKEQKQPFSNIEKNYAKFFNAPNGLSRSYEVRNKLKISMLWKRLRCFSSNRPQ